MSAINNELDLNNQVMDSNEFVPLHLLVSWRGSYRMMDSIVGEVEKMCFGSQVVKANLDKQSALDSRFGVMNVPTFIEIEARNILKQAGYAKSKNAILAEL